MSAPDPTDPLAQTLAAWQVTPSSSPDFRPGVWQRIQNSRPLTWAGYVRGHLAGWAVVAALALGVAGWTGHLAARARVEADREQMVISYLVNLDPRVLAEIRPLD